MLKNSLYSDGDGLVNAEVIAKTKASLYAVRDLVDLEQCSI